MSGDRRERGKGGRGDGDHEDGLDGDERRDKMATVTKK